MARQFTLCLVVTLLMVFAVISGSCEQTNQDGQKIQNRGTARYHFKLTSESTDFTALTTKSPRNKSSRAETASNSKKHETHFMKENSFRSRSKLSRMADGSAVTTRINARYLNSNVDNSQNRSKLDTSQVFKKEIMNSRHGDNKENTPESQRLKQQTASPRISLSASSVWIDSAKLDHEVFTKSPDYSRSRTGRKIYTNYNGKELKSQIIPSRKLTNENIEKKKNPIGKLEEKEELKNPRVENIASIANISKVINTKNMNDSNKRKEESIKERDVLPLDFESVLRVNIPLTIKNDENANLLTSATISSVKMSLRQASRLIKEKVESNDIVASNTKKNKQSDRSKSRRTSNANNLETVNSESISRRSSPRSAEIVNMAINGRSSSARRRSNAKNVNSRNRSAHKSRNTNTTETRNNDRNKNVDTNFETNLNKQTKTQRKLSNNERTSEEKRRSRNNRKLKVTEIKINQDKQNARAQSGNWSRTVSNLDITTTIPKATIAEATTISSLNIKIATVSSLSATIKSSTTARIFSSTEQTSRNKEKNRKEDSQIKKPTKEDFFNHGLGFRGRKISIEESSTAIANLRTTTFKSETQLHGNPGWTLRRRPNYINHDTPSTTFASVNQNQTNEIILSNDLSKSTETPLSNAKVLRRGTKRLKAKDENNILSSVAPKNVTRGSKTFNKSENFGLPKSIELEESDNYPLAFRDRLSQLKNSNLKFTGEKSTTRTSLQATKSSTENLFSEKSKLKLDLARRLIKPELNVDENNFDEMIFVSHSDKSQVKEISPISKNRNVEKTTKATNKFKGVHVSHESSIIANTQKEKSITKDRWKILEDRQSLKDRNIKGSFRSSMIKKNQIPTEKAIISSSLEGTSLSSISKFNIIPRRITISRRGTISVKETAATTIDTTKVRSMLQSTLVPREETSTLTNPMETLDKNNIVTTIEPLKLDETSIETIKSDKQERNNNDIQKETAVTLGTTSIMDTLIESGNIYTTEFAHEITLSPTVTTPSSMHSSTTESKKLYPVYIPDAKKHDLSENKSMKFVNDARKSIFQPRYTKQQDKVAVSMVTSMTVGPTSRYIKKKSGVFTPYDVVPKPLNTEATFTQTKHKEFRPRTATYRRHSEVPTNQLIIQQSSKADKEAIADFVTITSKPTKYNTHVTARSHSNSSEPLVNVKVDTLNDNLPLVFIESSNSNSSDSNIFNPTKSAIFSKNATTLLEQLRSTVAPLLNSLSEKTPIFSGAYSNVNIGNSAPRITPNGSAPRFSARYKGAELFIRKPSIEQVVIPSITTSSTTTSTLIEDTMTTTIAQGMEISSQIIQSEQPTETTITSIFTTSSEFPTVDTTTILSSSIEPITDTGTTTSTIPTTTLQTTSTKPSQADLASTTSFMPEATTPVININENLISTETTIIDTQNTMVASIESEELTTTTTITSPMSMPTTTTISPTTQSTTSERVISHPPSLGIINMGSYLRSFGGNQATTPASRFSSSSKTPIRDYQVYGIYPNKTIVRKRPEDNLIDARNINSPYVIFGIFPDGRLVRKFPNGTIISDSPRNPVEVVFTLSTTTTTNRPASRPLYNQVNQAGTYNQYKSPLYYSNSMYYSKPVKLMGDIQNLGPVDFGFTDNAIGVPSGVGPKFTTSFGPPASTPCANKMSDILLNTRMNTLPNVASMYGKLRDPIGSSIIKDHESSEASRIKVTSNQRSSVYIGQDKFINYQIDSAPDINSKVVDVKINSVATSMNEGVASSMTSIPSFENLLSNQSGGIVTSPSGFPWKDPLDQIFGIATNSSIQIASVASNQLNETTGTNGTIMARPINPLVEVFTPVISDVTPTNSNIESKSTTISISSITTTTPITTTIPITTTTPIITTIPTTIATSTAATTTTTTATTTSTTTTAATTTTTIPTTTAATPTLTTINQTTSSTSAPRLITTTSSINISSDVTTQSNIVSPTATTSADNILNRLQMNTKENVFGTTFEDLTFLNSLLQNNNVKTTSKTLNDIEQMLANRILALAKPELTRSPKSIKTISSNSVFNAIKDFPSSESSSEPIIIDLLPSLSTPSPSISASTTKKYTEAETALVQPSTVPLTTTKAPVVITAKSKTIIQHKTTTQAPVGFGVNLWRALFGSNRFEVSTIASAKKNPKSVTPRSVQATQKSIAITPKPIQIIRSTTPISHIMSAIKSHPTPRSVNISDIQVISTKLHADNVDSVSASTLSPISTQRTLLNNPNPRLNDVSTSTYSSKDDAKFLAALLRSIQTGTRTSTSTTTPKIIEDDEAFLRAILNNQANISTVIPSSTELNPAALLALLLKQQGIEPSTPAIKFKEQLQLTNLDLTTSRSMTTTTNRPALSSSTQSAVSMRRTTTPRRNTPRQSSKSSDRIPWSPSSTYPPPLFGENSGSGLITATRAIGQFLGAAITGAAQQLQSFLRNGTRSIPG
ncbi:hypothetical protein ACFW04_014220 [Cataglyphis niger]